jgi:hypothetical protein
MKGYLQVLILAVGIKTNSSNPTGPVGAAAPWLSAAMVPSPVRSRFSGHGTRLWMGISSKWRGARGGSHQGQRSSWDVEVVAHDGGAIPSGLVDDGGRLRCSSSLNKRLGSLATGSSYFPKPSIAACDDGG